MKIFKMTAVVLITFCFSFATVMAQSVLVRWDFNDGNKTDNFNLHSLYPATPAAEDNTIAGDEALTGGWEPGNLNNLPEAGVAWVVGSPKMFNGLKPGADPDNARINTDGVMDYSLGKPRIGVETTGSLNTFLLNMHGDHVHADTNDQIASSPVVHLGSNMWLSATSWGGGPGNAPEFDSSAAGFNGTNSAGYKTGSSGIAVLLASDSSFLGSVGMAHHGSFGVDSLDLSAFAGMDVFFDVVDAFEGGWGWLAVDAIQVGTEVLKIPVLGLAAQWKLDETSGSAVADELGNSNGTLLGGADSMWVKGWDGNAIDFAKAPADTTRILVDDNSAVHFDSTASFTISMLVKVDPVGNQAEQWLIHKDLLKYWYGMEFKQGQVRIAVDDDVNKTQLGVDITSIWPSNRWAHLVGVRNKADTTLALYLDGTLIGTMADKTTGPICDTLPLAIGNYPLGGNKLDGQLDDIRIYNYALDANAVQDLFKSYGIQKDAMIAHWKLDATSGTTVKDELGASNGTLLGGADSMWVQGWDGNAIDFAKAPADTTRISVSNNSVVNFDSTESFTISMLVKADPVGNQNEQWLIHKNLLVKWYGMEFKQGQVRIAVDDDVTKTQLGADITSIWPSNQWAQLVGVRDMTAGVLSLYLNGNLIGEMTDNTKGAISDTLPLAIGNYPLGGNKLDGQLDDIKIFNYALNSNAVKAMFDDYKLKSSVAAYWKFDETSGTTVKDTLGASNGTLVGGTDSMWVAGQVGNAIDFTKGSESVYIKVPSNSNVDFDSTESFSISMLVKADPVANQNEQWLLQKGQLKYWYGMEFKQGQVRIAVDDDVTKTQLGVDITNLKLNNFDITSWPPNQWVHLVGVRDRKEDSLKIYIDGELAGSMKDNTDMNISSDSMLTIGNFPGSTTNKLDGQLDDLKMYNYALSPAAVKSIYDAYKLGTPVSVASGETAIPDRYALEQNYPNPFNPSTIIQYQIPKEGHVQVSVYNILGQRVATLVDENMKTGIYKVTFNAANFASGIYFYRIKVNDFSLVKKMMLLK